MTADFYPVRFTGANRREKHFRHIVTHEVGHYGNQTYQPTGSDNTQIRDPNESGYKAERALDGTDSKGTFGQVQTKALYSYEE